MNPVQNAKSRESDVNCAAKVRGTDFGALREVLADSSMFEEIVGSSESLRRVLSQVAKVSHLGGTRKPMGIRWPAKIKHDAAPRPQFHHCNDVVPTIYEVLGITPPLEVNGIPQDPIDGVSFAYSFGDPKGQMLTQYFEIMGSRSIYHDGWMASALGPRIPWLPGLPPGIHEWTPDNDVWELYNLEDDWSQASDLAAKMPEKLAHLKDLFLIEAVKNKALPIGGGLWVMALHPEMRIVTPYTEWTFSGDTVRIPEFCAPSLAPDPTS